MIFDSLEMSLQMARQNKTFEAREPTHLSLGLLKPQKSKCTTPRARFLSILEHAFYDHHEIGDLDPSLKRESKMRTPVSMKPVVLASLEEEGSTQSPKTSKSWVAPRESSGR